ncbi:MAG: amidohydrolase family protein, partial [Proteobacteria bacterium]|nr:amidohydrolase family protein [Pseudomonadota bacterium]
MALALTGLSVWDGRAERASPRGWTIRIESGRIAAVGPDPELAADAREIPLDGCTAIPGLIDAHVHLTLDPKIIKPADQFRVPVGELEEAMVERARAMVRAGITTARDLGGGEWFELALRDRIAKGEVPGPRLLCAGQPLTSPGGHCHFWGGEAATLAEVEQVIDRQVASGADWIKLMATGGVATAGTEPSVTQFDDATVAHAVAYAGRRGRRVAAHCHGTSGIAQAARTGVRTIEHCSFSSPEGFGADLDAAVVAEVAKP